MALAQFLDADAGSAHDRFQAWRDKHPKGVLLSQETPHRAGLHGARCQHLGRPPYFSRAEALRKRKGGHRGFGSLTAKRKICGSLQELLTWATDEGISVRRCADCTRDRLLGKGEGSASRNLKLRTFRNGDAPKRGEGLRIGTTRRPPRGATREEWAGHFDVWFPILAPSAKLLASKTANYRTFCARYTREINSRAESRQALELLAQVALRTAISIGCYCTEESRCHRRHLRKLIERQARLLQQ